MFSKSVLIFSCCITNYCKFSSLQHTFLWQNSRHNRAGFPLNILKGCNQGVARQHCFLELWVQSKLTWLLAATSSSEYMTEVPVFLVTVRRDHSATRGHTVPCQVASSQSLSLHGSLLLQGQQENLFVGSNKTESYNM